MEQIEPTGDTNVEADRLINRLMSSDPNFDDCTDAAHFIHRMTIENKGPNGYATWKDAAIAERVRRVKAETAAQSVRDAAMEVLHDGHAVYQKVKERAGVHPMRVTADGIADVLDAVVALIQSPSVRDADQPIAPGKDKP